MIKAEFSASLLQSSVSHDTSEIILISWFDAQENSYYYQCRKQLCCLGIVAKKDSYIYWMLVYLMWYTLGDAEYSADDHLGLDLSFRFYLWMLWCYWLVLIPCSVDYISRKVNEQLMWRIHWIHFFYPLVFLLQFCLNILGSIDVFISDINNLTFF